MILLELAAQGIRGFSPAGGRATLRQGYNVIAADGAVLRRLIEALFYPSPRDGEALPRATGGPANAPVRAGLTVVGNDRLTYRVIRDFATGAQLHRFDPQKRSFAPLSQDLAEISAFMQKTVGVPAPAKLRALLAVASGDLPSKQGGAGGGVAQAAPARASLTPEQAKKRTEALKVELAKAKVAEKMQGELDELQARQFKIEETLRGGAKLQEELDRAQAALAEHGPARELITRLGDPDARVAAYEKAVARKAEADGKVAAEREAIEESEQEAQPRPFWKDPLFWVGAGGGLLLLAAGIAGSYLRNELRYISLLDLGSFGWAGWVALRWVSATEVKDRVDRRKKVVGDWEKKVEAQFKKDTAEVADAVNALRGQAAPGSAPEGVSNAAVLREALSRAREAVALAEEVRGKLAAWQASPEVEKARTEKAKIEESIWAIEAKLSAEVGSFVRDVRSVEAELRRIETEAAAPRSASAQPAASAAPARPPGDPIRVLMDSAAAEAGGSPSAAVRSVAQKASQTLGGLSFSRLQSLQVDDRGNLQVQSGGRPVAMTSLALADRDLIWVALKLAFLEQALAAGKQVALCEDAFSGLSDGSRRFAARLLKQIAKPGQILHATSDPSFKEAADHAA